MFDIGWSELLVIAVATLIVVGPKDLPIFLRTIGKYVGVLKRQASEFRTHFDDAIRETEFDQLKKDVESIKSDFESSVRDTTAGLTSEFDDMKKSLDDATKAPQLEGPASQEVAELEPTEGLGINDPDSLADDSFVDVNTLNQPAISDIATDNMVADAGSEVTDAGDAVEDAAGDVTEAPKKTAGA